MIVPPTDPEPTTNPTVTVPGAILSDEQRVRTAEWLRANGVDPALVALRDIVVQRPAGGDGTISFTQYLLDETGHKYRDPATTNAATARREVPLTVPLPSELGDTGGQS